jgi:hypothetical protein
MVNLTLLETQKLDILSLPVRENDLNIFMSQEINDGRISKTVFACIQDIISKGIPMNPESFKQIKEKISTKLQSGSILIALMNQIALKIFSPNKAAIKDLATAIETNKISLINKPSFTNIQEIETVTRLLKNGYHPLTLDLARKIISSLTQIDNLGEYAQNGQSYTFTLSATELKLFKELQTIFNNKLNSKLSEDSRKEFKTLATMLKNCISCNSIGLNPQTILQDNDSGNISKFLFNKHAIYQFKYFGSRVSYQLINNKYEPFCSFKTSGKNDNNVITSLNDIASMGAAKNANEWKILPGGFIERSRDYWKKLEPIARIENWSSGAVIEMSAYLSNSLLSVEAGSHTALRFIDKEGNVYSVGIASDAFSGSAKLSSPDWMFFFPPSLKQEVVSRYSLTDEALSKIILKIEEMQCVRLKLLELENKKIEAEISCKQALKNLETAKQEKNSKSITSAQTIYDDEKTKLKDAQDAFKSFIDDEDPFKSFIDDEITRKQILEVSYYGFGNNCSSFSKNIVDLAKKLGAKPVVIHSSELKEGQKTSLSLFWRMILKINSAVFNVLGHVSYYFGYGIEKEYSELVKNMTQQGSHGIIFPIDMALYCIEDNNEANYCANNP